MLNPLRTIREMVAIAQSRGVAPERFDAKSAPVVREVDAEAVRRGLAGIRRRRRWAHWPFMGVWFGMVCLVLWRGAGLPAPDVPDVVVDTLADAALLAGFGCLVFVRVLGLLCPRCREPFHMGGGRSTNRFARRCHHCELRLDGANAAEPFTVRGDFD